MTVHPFHDCCTYFPDGREEHHYTFPVARIRRRFECKYCHEEHTNWWLMNQRDYQVAGLVIILCAKCEHTSAIDEHDKRLPNRASLPVRGNAHRLPDAVLASLTEAGGAK